MHYLRLSIIVINIFLIALELVRRMPRFRNAQSELESGTGAAGIWLISFIGADLFLYGLLLPLTSAMMSGLFAFILRLAPEVELILVIGIVVILLFGTFNAKVEARFWKNLFGQQSEYKWVLQIRDVLNLVMIFVNLLFVMESVLVMFPDKEFKEEFWGEGLRYYFLRKFANLGFPISETYLKSYLPRPDLDDVLTLQFSPGGNGPFVHEAQFVFSIACLTASLTKLVYFNTLLTYLRAMDVFISMQDEDLAAGDEDSQTDAVSNYISDFSMSANLLSDGYGASSNPPKIIQTSRNYVQAIKMAVV